MKLYEIGEARNILDEFLAELEGEETPDIAELMAQLELDRNEKIKRVALYIEEQREFSEAIDREIARLTRKKKATDRGVAGLERYLALNMQSLAIEKLDTPQIKVNLRRNPPAVKGELTVEQLRALHATHPAFVRHTPEHTVVVPEQFDLDKKAIVDAWKAAGTVGEGKKKTFDEDKARAAVPAGLDVTRGLKVEIK